MIILVWKSYCWRILLYFSFALLFIPFSSSAAIIYLHFVCLSLGTHPSPYLYFLTLLFITLTCKATLVHWNTLLFMSEGISRCLCVIRQHCLCLCSVFPLQFPGHGELLWGEAKVRGERRAPGLRFYALVRVLQRLQERLGTTKQEHLQREVSWSLVGWQKGSMLLSCIVGNAGMQYLWSLSHTWD